MTCLEALEYLNTYQARGIVPGVEHLYSFLASIGNPQKAYPSVIVAGTNGKGSTVMALSEILLRSGYKVGTYTSPHLHTFRERIKINLVDIEPDFFASIVAELKQDMENFKGFLPEGRMTYFEIGTMAAFKAFEQAEIDVAVLEVGMGGRLDATNVSEPIVSLITNIGTDHAEFLGEGILDRAGEKFGVARQGGILVTTAPPGAVREFFRARAGEIGAWARFLGDDFHLEAKPFPGDGEKFHFFGKTLALRDVKTRLIGAHQVVNMGLALAAVEVLLEKGWNIPERAIRDGMLNVKWPGRLELFSAGNRAPILIDGAHNPDAAEVLVYAILSRFRYNRLFAVIGMLSTKRYQDYLRVLSPILSGAGIFVTQPDQPNPRPAGDLAQAIREAAKPGFLSVVPIVSDAIKNAQSAAGENDLILVTGSLYTVLEAREFLGLGRRGEGE